jgi:hypothetical protein
MSGQAVVSPNGVLIAIAAVQAEVTHVDKGDQYNGGQVRFAYRGIDRVVQALSGSMRKHKLLMLPKSHGAPEWIPCTTAQGKPANVARLEVTYTLYGPDGSSVEVTAPGEAMDSGDKAVSKAMSVAWRTALIQTFNLPTGEPDPDSEGYELGSGRGQQQSGSPSERDQAAIRRLEARDQAMADWNASVDEAAGDYDALGRLLNQARQKRAPKEILDRIMKLGKEAKP